MSKALDFGNMNSFIYNPHWKKNDELEGPVRNYSTEYFETKNENNYNAFLDKIKNPKLPPKREVVYENE